MGNPRQTVKMGVASRKNLCQLAKFWPKWNIKPSLFPTDLCVTLSFPFHSILLITLLQIKAVLYQERFYNLATIRRENAYWNNFKWYWTVSIFLFKVGKVALEYVEYIRLTMKKVEPVKSSWYFCCFMLSSVVIFKA